ncbi:protein SUPPRESSOR OF MAX2 1-like [Ipomoea triloba]|uniref:protein SUPPRESSOR OF MAX2 1-like n=1 Tax=Ipomoea triloba TaxID=35885 RepID=UPI00125E66A3|nr:protein SUPPRESSOR OF MAX2 1-like [Ipomoea triloba]
MRSGLSTILQTLTPEAASVLNHSIAEASRRNHGQTTPLHVAATLLGSPSGYLRQACIRSHPNSSHPLQCRALELCFSVALERLPTAQNMPPGTEPPVSNALNAALKRAQANQRRGCPEQQQQPLLAVKVELEQLIISILDDPGVSRVMREASFSSPAVKATIEQTLNSTSNHTHHHTAPVNLGSFSGIGPRMLPNPAAISPAPPNRNMYLNPRLGSGQVGNQNQTYQRNEELRKVLEILAKTKKRNPILVGEGEPEAVAKELFRRIEKSELGAAGEGPLKNLQLIPIDKDSLLSDKTEIPVKIKELGGLIGTRLGNGKGVILDLGDLKWLVEQPPSGGIPATQQPQPVVSDASRTAVAEIAKLLAAFAGDRIWLIGTATCETYLRCQVYHSSMENDWDLQAVPMASKSTNPGIGIGISPWLGKERLLSNPCESLSPLKTFPVAAVPPLLRCIPENVNLVRRASVTTSCPQCMEKYEQELAKLVSEFENSPSDANSDSARPTLPQWLQNAKISNGDKGTSLSQSKDQELLKLKTQALQKKWSEKCLQLHPNFHHNVGSEKATGSPMLGMPSLQNPNLLLRQPLQPKLQTAKSLGETLQPKLQSTKGLGETLQPKLQTTKGIGEALQLNTQQRASSGRPPQLATSPPESPVRTELVLGQKPTEITSQKSQDDHVKDFLGCISLESEKKILGKFASALDADTYKRLLKGLVEKAWWQQDAASAVASAVTKCRLGNGRQRGGASKGDTWLIFTGPDRIGKRKMASVLADQICGASPILVSLGSRRDDEETEKDFRGKTAIDRIAEAVRRNPFSVIMLEDVDEANMLVRGNIKRAMERGRLTDSHGREISLGNIIFILTGNWSTINPESYRNENSMDDKKMASLSSGNWQLRLAIGQKSTKRGASWLYDDEDRPTKQRKELGLGLGFDLNEAADTADDRADGSHNSSDLTIEHEDELGLENMQFSITSVPHELVNAADDLVVFKPIDFALVRRKIKKTISSIEDKVVIEVEEEVIDRILAGLWRGQMSLDEWVHNVLAPSFDKLQPRLSSPHDDNTIVRLQLEPDTDLSGRSATGEWLPSKVTVTAS